MTRPVLEVYPGFPEPGDPDPPVFPPPLAPVQIEPPEAPASTLERLRVRMPSDKITGWIVTIAQLLALQIVTGVSNPEGRVVAVLSLYSARPHVFDDQMRELLLGMAENLSFALDGFDRQQRLVEVAEERTLLTERLIEANQGRPVDVVFDMAGGVVFEQSLRALAPFGRIVVCGIASKKGMFKIR